MPTLMVMADKVTKLSAICSVGGADEVFHKRIIKEKTADALSTDPSLMNTLSDNVYGARCKNCYRK